MAFKILDYIEQYLVANQQILEGKSSTQIAQLLIDTDPIVSKRYQIRKNQWNIKGLSSSIRVVKSRIPTNQESVVQEKFIDVKEGLTPKELKTPYKVIADNHHFFPIKGHFSLPNKLVDDMFYSYSKHGLDLSVTQMLQKYNLEPWQWHAVKNALRLYKTSDIFSKHTIDSTDPETMRNAIREKLEERVNKTHFIVEQEYYKTTFKKYNDVIKQQAKQDLIVQTIVTELADLLPTVQIPQGTWSYSTTQTKPKEINVVIADLHFGAKNNPDNRHLPHLSLEWLHDVMFNKVLPSINQLQADKVNVFLAGDLIESATGLNHIDSWKGMQEGLYGAKLIKSCYQFLVQFLSGINNLNKVIGIAGNHDRMTSSKQEDTDCTIAEIIFEFLKLSLQTSNIQVIFDSKLTNVMIDDIVYIMSHGHEKLTDNGSQLVLKYGDQHKFNVLLSGHWHNRKIAADTDIFRHIVAPSIFPGNNYSVSLGYSSVPGFLIIENNGFGKPLVHDYSI